jgi:hypothetical protein
MLGEAARPSATLRYHRVCRRDRFNGAAATDVNSDMVFRERPRFILVTRQA